MRSDSLLRSWESCLGALALAMVLTACRTGAPVVVTDDAGVTAEEPDAGVAFDSGFSLFSPDAGQLFASCDGGGLGSGTLLAGGLDTPRRLATDGLAIFVSEQGGATGSNGQVTRIGLADGNRATLAGGFRAPDAIAVDDVNVYLVDGAGVWRIGKADGVKMQIDATLTRNQLGETELLVRGDDLILASGSRLLVRLGRDGSGRRVLFDGGAGTSVRGAVLEGATVFFLVSGAPQSGLFQVPLDGSMTAKRIRAEAASARSLALTLTQFIWAEGTGGAGRLRIAPRVGNGAAIDLATGLDQPTRPVVAGKFVYFADQPAQASERFFQRASLCAPGRAEPVGPVGVGPGGLLFDGAAVYFTSARGAPDGELLRVP